MYYAPASATDHSFPASWYLYVHLQSKIAVHVQNFSWASRYPGRPRTEIVREAVLKSLAVNQPASRVSTPQPTSETRGVTRVSTPQPGPVTSHLPDHHSIGVAGSSLVAPQTPRRESVISTAVLPPSQRPRTLPYNIPPAPVLQLPSLEHQMLRTISARSVSTPVPHIAQRQKCALQPDTGSSNPQVSAGAGSIRSKRRRLDGDNVPSSCETTPMMPPPQHTSYPAPYQFPVPMTSSCTPPSLPGTNGPPLTSVGGWSNTYTPSYNTMSTLYETHSVLTHQQHPVYAYPSHAGGSFPQPPRLLGSQQSGGASTSAPTFPQPSVPDVGDDYAAWMQLYEGRPEDR